MNKILSILESLMPGRLAKVLSVLTIVTASLLYNATPIPLTTQTPLSTMQEMALQQSQSLLALLLGMAALIASLIYETNKVKEQKIKIQAASRSLHKSLVIIMKLVDEETKRIKDRQSVLQVRDLTTYTKDTIAEINGLNSSGHFIEKLSATLLRYVDSDEAQSQPVVQPNDK